MTKKRFYLTLTKENTEQMHKNLLSLGLGKNALSGLVDDWLLKFAPTLQKMADKKLSGQQLTFEEILGDLFGELSKTLKEE